VNIQTPGNFRYAQQVAVCRILFAIGHNLLRQTKARYGEYIYGSRLASVSNGRLRSGGG
jgi:hypothetical protein